MPEIVERANGSIIVNPGSPTFPRSMAGPTIARLMVQDGHVVSSNIVKLKVPEKDGRGKGRFFMGW